MLVTLTLYCSVKSSFFSSDARQRDSKHWKSETQEGIRDKNLNFFEGDKNLNFMVTLLTNLKKQLMTSFRFDFTFSGLKKLGLG